MSLSINNSPFIKVDTSPMDRPASPSATGANQAPIPSNLSVSRTPVRNENAQVLNNQVVFNSGAFTKLFDMLELVFKSMREMLAGKNATPDALPDAEKALKVKLETAPQTPVKPEVVPQPAVKPGVVPQPAVKPEVVPQPAVKPEVVPQPAVKPEVVPQPAVKPEVVPQPAVKPEVVPQPAVKPEGVPQPRVKPDAAPQPALPVVPLPTVNVTNDANAQVKVEVNVNHCHCPDDKAEHDKGVRPRIAPKYDNIPYNDIPNVQPKTTNITPSVPPKPDATPKSDLKPQSVPKDIPENDTTPKVDPDLPKPQPDLTSPPPKNNQADRNGQRFNSRTWQRT